MVEDSSAEVAAATEQILSDAAGKDEHAGWDQTAWDALADAGLTLVAVPEAAGGGGGTLREAAEVVRVAGAYAARLPIAETSLVASWLLDRAGLAVPTGVLTVAAGGGVTAEPGPDGRWQLTGRARRVPYGRFADGVVVLATGPSGRVVAVVPPATAPGGAEGADLAGDPRDEVDLTGLVLPGGAAVVGPEVAAELALRQALGRLLLISGAAAQVLTMTVRYVSEREQFGRAIGRFQAVQHLVAELAGEVTALQVGADAAVLAVSSGSPSAWLAVAAAKTDADRSVHSVTAIAHQLHGAIGATHEHALQRYTLRLWSWRDEGGTAAAWADGIAARVLASGAPSLWAQLTGNTP